MKLRLVRNRNLYFWLVRIILKTKKVQVLRGHTDYINSIVYEPEKGDLVLSGSDDHTAKMWEESECVATVNFSSPVMSVAWHQQDLGKVGLSMACSVFILNLKVLIGQKSGVVSLLNSSSLVPILSIDCGSSPLLSTSWKVPKEL